MAGYIGSKAVLLSTTAATVTGAADIGGDLTVDTNTLYVDSANNRVGVGTSSPAAQLTLTKEIDATLRLESTDDKAVFAAESDTYGTIEFYSNDSSAGGAGIKSAIRSYVGNTAGGQSILAFTTSDASSNDLERLRIDSSGNLLVGKTGSDATTQGFEARSNGLGIFNVYNNYPLQLRRYGNDGDIIDFRKDGTRMGGIGVAAGDNLYITSTATNHAGIYMNDTGVLPMSGGSLTDNTRDLGGASNRWDDVYATNGTIQTSDANEKQDIAELDEAEKRVAVAAKGLIRKYRWKDAVAEKGDAARIHVGIIAQDLQAAFAAEGLDAGRYAMFISSTWWEHEGQTYETAEEAPEGATERTRLGVRYPELLAFIIGAM